jgi:hypothetical protein
VQERVLAVRLPERRPVHPEDDRLAARGPDIDAEQAHDVDLRANHKDTKNTKKEVICGSSSPYHSLCPSCLRGSILPEGISDEL